MLNMDVNHFYLKWSGYKTPNNKTPKNKAHNATKRPNQQKAQLQNDRF